MTTLIENTNQLLQINVYTTKEFDKKFKEGRIKTPIKKKIILGDEDIPTIKKKKSENVKKIINQKNQKKNLNYKLNSNKKALKKNKIGLELNYTYSENLKNVNLKNKNFTPDKENISKRNTYHIKNFTKENSKKYQNDNQIKDPEKTIKKKQKISKPINLKSQNKLKKFKNNYDKNYYKMIDFDLNLSNEDFLNSYQIVNVGYPISKKNIEIKKNIEVKKKEINDDNKYAYIFREKEKVGSYNNNKNKYEYLESGKLPLDEKRMLKKKFLENH